MENKQIYKSAILMLVIVLAAVTTYEIFLRNNGITVAYDDSPALWSDKRANVYGAKDKQVVFIGSSRIKFDLDIPTWEKHTGLNAIQLAMVGSSPMPALEDLAADANFNGRLIIDVTEPLFFSDLPPYLENPTKNIAYFHDRTLAQQASTYLNKGLESQLVFLDKDNFSLNSFLDGLPIPNREGIFTMPTFPTNFDRSEYDRQSYMTSSFVADPDQVNTVRGIWNKLLSGPHGPPMTDAQIGDVLAKVKKCTDKILASGGEVIFVRTPSSGPFLMGETMGFPRVKYWDRLLAVTGCKGIHFQDYPKTASLQCPEFSHLSRPDAILYTQAFIDILSEKGWNIKEHTNKKLLGSHGF